MMVNPAASMAADTGSLPLAGLEQLLEVTRRLAAPFDLTSMLKAVTAAARQLLRADRCSVWLHDAAHGELVLEVASDIGDVRLPIGTGLVGACARDRALINVPDCYADPRFDPAVDRRSGYRTRSSLTLPLVGHDGALVGVMQAINRADGAFDAGDERLALALAAQAAVALQRVRLTEALIEGQRMRQELEVARVVQTSTLPATMPRLPGWDCHGLSRPATLTGGDTFDLALTPQGLLVVLADATGHGVGPALSVARMHAMLRMGLRLGATLDSMAQQLNNLLCDTLADGQFITAFIGLLDPATHALHYVSAGQGPILHFHAETGTCSRHLPTCFPLGALPLTEARAASVLWLQPGDRLLLLSDGIYEHPGPAGDMFGVERVEACVATHRQGGMAALAQALLAQVQAFAGAVPQDDDITLVLVQRDAAASGTLASSASFPRRIDALAEVFEFTQRWGQGQGLSAALQFKLEFVIEELFTNLVRHGQGDADVVLGLRRDGALLKVELDDPDGAVFDPRHAPEVDTEAPLEQRLPGGLGLHLVQRMVDHIEAGRDPVSGHGRIAFSIMLPPAEAGFGSTAEGNSSC